MLLFVFLIAPLLKPALSDCEREYFGHTSIVCKCNATHCDTIQRPEIAPPSKFLFYTSNKAGLRFSTEEGVFNESVISENVLYIRRDEEYQTILGWGDAFTDASGLNIAALPEEVQEQLLRAYFSEDGFEYNLGRVPIACTDFGNRLYTYHDNVSTNFNLSSEDYRYKIPYIKRAQSLAKGNSNLIGSAWVAPKWMKTNSAYTGFGFIKNNMYQVWAEYFINFLDFYTAEGVDFWGITTGNEPSTAFLLFIEMVTVGWLPYSQSKWIAENLGPTIRNSSHKDIKILLFDDQIFLLPWYVEQVFVDETAREYIDGIAFHWYLNTLTPVGVLNATHTLFTEMFLLSTETSTGGPPNLGKWENGEMYSIDIIQDLLNWAGGYIDWNLALDLNGGPNHRKVYVDAPIITNTAHAEFYKQPQFYHIGHFSKFIPRTSVRIGTSANFNQNIMVVAFQRPDNGTVLVILNHGINTVDVTFADSGRLGSITLTPRSISTVLYW